MGNEIGQAPSHLGITSLAVTTPNIEVQELQKLHTLLKTAVAGKENDLITRDELKNALNQIEKFTPPDNELFLQLFILFDEDGMEMVDYKPLIAGSIIALISTLTNTEKLQLAFSVYDKDDSKHILRRDLKVILQAINSTAAYFGDPVLSMKEVDTMTLELFKSVPSQAGLGAKHSDVIAFLLQHQVILKFMKGEGTIKFGSPELAMN